MGIHISSYSHAGNESSATLVFTGSKPGDFLMIHSVRIYGDSINIPVEWSQFTDANNIQCLYKFATASDEAVTYFRNSATYCVVAHSTFRGIHTTDPFSGLVANIVGSSSLNYSQMQEITPANNDAIILYACPNKGSGGQMRSQPDLMHLTSARDSYKRSIMLAMRNHANSNTPASAQIFNVGSVIDPWSPSAYVLRDSGEGFTAHVSSITPCAKILHAALYNGGDLTEGDISDSSVFYPTITNGGYTEINFNKGGSTDVEGSFQGDNFSLESNTVVEGEALTLTHKFRVQKNLAGEILSCALAGEANFGRLSKLGRAIALSDGINTKLWHLEGKDSLPRSDAVRFPTVVELDNNTEISEEGVLSTSAIEYIIFCVSNTAPYSRCVFAPVYIQRTAIILGGSASHQASILTAKKHVSSVALNTVQSQSGQSNFQFYCSQSIQIGDGVNPCYFKGSLQAVEYPEAYTVAGKKIANQVSAGSWGVKIKTSPSCTVDLSDMAFNMGNFHNFSIDASSSILATTSFIRLSVLNAGLQLNTLAITGASFSFCKEITFASLSDLSGGNNFSGCVDSYQITISNQTDFHKLDNCSFRDNNVAIRITGDQTGVWSDPNMTFSGNVTDIEYTGTTNFEIGSLTAINVVNSGTGVLSVNPPQPTLTITLSESNCEIRLYEADGLGVNMGTEIDGVESFAGTEYTYQHNGSINDIYIQVILLDYEEVTLPFQLNSTNQFINIDLQLETND